MQTRNLNALAISIYTDRISECPASLGTLALKFHEIFVFVSIEHKFTLAPLENLQTNEYLVVAMQLYRSPTTF